MDVLIPRMLLALARVAPSKKDAQLRWIISPIRIEIVKRFHVGPLSSMCSRHTKTPICVT